MNARNFLRKGERQAVAEAVADAERRTSAEFVCAIASESGRYDRAESLVGLVVGLLALAAVGLAASRPPADSWLEARVIPLGWLALAVVVGFVLGSALASQWHTVRRPFTTRGERDAEVARAASHVFALSRLASTRKRAGVLIYVSVFERRVAVLADAGAAQVLGQSGIDELRDLAGERLRGDRRLEAFGDTLRAAVERLAAALPAEVVDPDELPNALVILHPRP